MWYFSLSERMHLSSFGNFSHNLGPLFIWKILFFHFEPPGASQCGGLPSLMSSSALANLKIVLQMAAGYQLLVCQLSGRIDKCIVNDSVAI